MVEVSIRKTFRSYGGAFNYNIKSDNNRLVLFGPSGSGKTSLLKMIAGFYAPDYGTIKINNKIFFHKKKTKIPIHKRNIGYIPQEYTLFPHMTVKNNILYGVKINKLNPDKQKFSLLISKLEIEDKVNLFPYQLSGGEKQRVAIARALMINPDILLLDEPFSALDKGIRENLREMVIELLDTSDTKAIFVTHDIDEAFDFGNEIYIVYNGRIIEYGNKEKVFNSPDFFETAKLLDFKNIWKAEIGILKKFNIPNIMSRNYDFIAVKPENIHISKKQHGKFNIQAKVKKIKTYASFTEITLSFDNMNIISKKSNNRLKQTGFQEGEKLYFSFLKENIVYLKKYFH